MDQRVAFIADWLRDEWTMSELARVRDQPQDGLQVGGPVRRRIASVGWPNGRAPPRCMAGPWPTRCATR